MDNKTGGPAFTACNRLGQGHCDHLVSDNTGAGGGYYEVMDTYKCCWCGRTRTERRIVAGTGAYSSQPHGPFVDTIPRFQ
jgi:hypothetical protein